MNHHQADQTDFGTGQKKLGIYIVGLIACSLLTLVSFWVVMSNQFNKRETLVIIYSAACLQFFIQLICFLRLNTQTEQGRANIMSLIFTGVILISIIAGSLWIMWNLGYYMM